MKQIKIADSTLCMSGNAFSFKEKIEIARQLEKLNVDFIELPEIVKVKSDTLLVRTISSFVKKSTISVSAGSNEESIKNAADALKNCENGIIRIELPVSPVRMEYDFHKKAKGMLEWIEKSVSSAAEKKTVEFCALDATRAEKDFLFEVIKTAVGAGASLITVCDDAGEMMPDEFANFVKEVGKVSDKPLFVRCSDKNGMALSQSVLAVKSSDVNGIKTAVCYDAVNLESLSEMLRNCGEKHGIVSSIRYTEVRRIVNQIKRIADTSLKNDNTSSNVFDSADEIQLNKNDDKETVISFAARLGYDLSEEDQNNVYEEFLRVSDKKTVGAKELDAIVISSALQVPATYKLDNYIVNSGNTISSSAQVTLKKDDKVLTGISIGDGPIDAAFLAMEQITGNHYELEDFQIQTVTQSKESIGSSVVKLRHSGKIYSGNGVSTDIIEASIRAYLSAVNKIVYEEVQ